MKGEFIDGLLGCCSLICCRIASLSSVSLKQFLVFLLRLLPSPSLLIALFSSLLSGSRPVIFHSSFSHMFPHMWIPASLQWLLHLFLLPCSSSLHCSELLWLSHGPLQSHTSWSLYLYFLLLLLYPKHCCWGNFLMHSADHNQLSSLHL